MQIAFSLFERGANIYGPFEAGFDAGMACAGDNDTGDCAAGSDVPTCIYELRTMNFIFCKLAKPQKTWFSTFAS